MRKLSKINETSWGGMIRRSSSEVKRKQDMGNLDEIQWVDFGLPFLVADRFYEASGTSLFSYYEAEKIFSENENIRMFNEKEFDGFLKCCSLKQTDEGIQISGNGNTIVLPYMYRLDRTSETWLYGKKNDFGHSIGLLENDNTSGLAFGRNENGQHILLTKREGINETSWGGMVRRSSGNVVRKQDELDAMSLENFKDHLETLYEPVKKGLEILLHHPDSKMDMCILVPYAESRRGLPHYFYYNGKSIWTFDFGGQGGVTQRLKDKFDVEIDKKDLTHVSLGGKVSNSLFIDVLDFLLDVVAKPVLKRKVNETSWGGMVRRSSSDVVRKQDELDWINLGPEFDCLWLNGIYEKDGKNEFIWDEVENIVASIPGVGLPELEDLKKLKCWFSGKDEETIHIEGSENHMTPMDEKGWRVWYNKELVCLLSLGLPKTRFVSDGDKYPFLLVKRMVNETSWGGMVRRSSSEVKRKEDDVNLMGIDEFEGWLKDRYKILDKYGASIFKSKTSYRYISFPLFVNGYKMFRSSISYNEDGSVRKIHIFATKEECGELFDVVEEKFNVYVDGGIEVKNKNGKLSNSVFVDLIETVLENSETKLYEKVE